MRDENEKRKEMLKASGIDVDAAPNLLQEDHDDDVLFQSIAYCNFTVICLFILVQIWLFGYQTISNQEVISR